MILWPCGVNAPQSRGFDPANNHYGIDFAVPVGTRIIAVAAGRVIYKADERDGYGNTLTIDHGNGAQSRYAHLIQFAVGVGNEVNAGDLIGLTGGERGAPGAGNSTGPHLHFEYRTNPSTPIDPMPLFTDTPSGTQPALAAAAAHQEDTTMIVGIHNDGRAWAIEGGVVLHEYGGELVADGYGGQLRREAVTAIQAQGLKTVPLTDADLDALAQRSAAAAR